MQPATSDSIVHSAAEAPFGGTLAEWLDWKLTLHAQDIALGLERVRQVAARLDVLTPAPHCVVVAGTNGKGSCVHLIEALLRCRGHRVGAYTSPHLWRYNERVRVDGTAVADADLCVAFAAVERARRDTALTYFEYGTLAALWLFQRSRLDYAVLEVGLGGRLDAVNIIDADVALVTNIGLDHAAWLGNNRQAIGCEKAGVMRPDRPVVCADRAPPPVLQQHADTVGATFHLIGRDFDIGLRHWHGRSGARLEWPQVLPPHVLADNMAAALAVTALLSELPLPSGSVQQAAADCRQLRGRCEVVDDGRVPVIYDVAHNCEAMAVLVDYLQANPVPGATHVVVGMLADKPVEAVTRLLAPLADCMYAADLASVSPRGLDSAALAGRMGHGVQPAGMPDATLAMVRASTQPGDRIVVCGSFFTVALARAEV